MILKKEKQAKLSRGSNLDHPHGRSTPRPLRHAAKDGALFFVSSERVSVSACRFTVVFWLYCITTVTPSIRRRG